MMKRTPLHQEHLKLKARMVEFGGWEMPVHYPPGILNEHLATRKAGGLFDISHMGRFRVSGPESLTFLQHVLTNNAASLLPLQAQYTIIPNENGGAVDDAYLYRLDGEYYLLVVNAANTEKDWQWFQSYRSRFPRLVLEDCTANIAMLSLQGPKAKAVLEAILGDRTKLPEPLRNRMSIVELSGSRVPISRTGYTGEPIGFELFPPTPLAVELWNKILETGCDHGLAPVGLGARDTLRLEAGLPLYGHELGTDPEGKEIPILALPAARFAMSFSPGKGDFVGREALMGQFQEIKARREGTLDKSAEQLLVPRAIMMIAVCGAGIARAGCPVMMKGQRAGYVTSGTTVPYWQNEGEGIKTRPADDSERRTICLAYVDANAEEGQKAEVQIRERTAEAVVVARHVGGEAPPYARPIFTDHSVSSAPSKSKLPLENLAVNLVKRAHDNTLWRRHEAINLIPSEQTPSPLVRLLAIMDPIGRYAEHRKVEALGDIEAYYYQGTGFIAEIERELNEELKKFLGCSEVESRLISGQMANATVFSGLVDYVNRVDRRAPPRRLRYVMNHHLGRGGHLSAQPMGALRDFVAIDPVTERWAVVNFPILPNNPYRIDMARTEELIAEYRPELVILGKSMTLHREPVKELAEMVADLRPKPIIMYDAAHVLGLFGPHFQEPLSEGADIVTASTHKTFFGTQRGIIASNMSEGTDYGELWDSIVKRAFPGSVSNHHLGTLLGLLMAAYEMNGFGKEYQRQVLTNARAFARTLKDNGLQVEGDSSIGYTETHQVVLRVGYARGVEIADRLEKNNIIVNYQALPDDEGFTASSGLRTGVQEMTRFGMKEADFAQLADYMAAVILKEKDIASQVSSFRRRFTTMQYCLPQEQARPLLEQLITNLK